MTAMLWSSSRATVAAVMVAAGVLAGCAAVDASGAAQAAPPTFDSSRAWEHLRRQVGFGPRPSGSTALDDTRRYILDQLKGMDITASQQAFTARTPRGEVPMANVVATIRGRRTDRIILASHFDTKRSTDFRFVGANDGASSTAALLELGRVIRARRNDFTFELLFLDGEEATNWDWGVTGVDNIYGSRHYVDVATRAGTLAGIKGLILLDMIGERNVMVRREAKSTPWLVDIIWTTARRLGHDAAFSNEVMEVDDDHVPFLRAGVPAVDVIDLDYPQWHTAQDDLDHVSARSLQTIGDVILASIPAIEKRAAAAARR